jgi:hypothetical protein
MFPAVCGVVTISEVADQNQCPTERTMKLFSENPTVTFGEYLFHKLGATKAFFCEGGFSRTDGHVSIVSPSDCLYKLELV